MTGRWGLPGRRPRSRQADAAGAIDAVAHSAQQLAVLLSAGISPGSAWGYLLSPEPAAGAGHESLRDRVIRAAARAGSVGDRVAAAVAGEARVGRMTQVGPTDQVGQAWLGLAAAWQVATEVGAPLAACLNDLAASLRDLGELHRDLEVALTGPAATARMVMVLPVVGIVFGALLGFNTLATLFLTLPGWLCLVLGGGLMATGHVWNRRLVERARVRDPVPGLELDLAAIGMTGGGSAERAQTLARAAMEQFLPSPAPKSGSGQAKGSAGAIARVLALSSRAGIPAAALLRSEAAQQRRECRSAGQRAAAALSVQLMIPLGVCVLPAFMLLGVIPLLVTVLSSTFGRF